VTGSESAGKKTNGVEEPALDGSRRRWSWKIGRPFGITLYVHATFFLLLLWVGLTSLLQGGVQAAIRGLGLIVAVFGTVVLHELSHALTARRFGIRTREIILLPIGGVSSLERLPEKPSQELLVALAGPFTNLIIALGLFGILRATGGPVGFSGASSSDGPFLTTFMWINVSLAVFNLIPAFPMDGGRVLRAALALRMPYARATEVAARLGQAIALVFGLLGLLFNPVLVLIALFVWMGAQNESSLVQLRSALAGLPVQNAMITDFQVVGRREPLSRAVELTLAGFQQDFPVVEEHRAVGVLTRADLVRGLAEAGKTAPVEDFMHRDFGTAEPGEMLERALSRFGQHEPSTLVVTTDNEVLGIVTPENIGELVMFENAVRQGRRAQRQAIRSREALRPSER
jgi:Zn-dependent protease/predicted transcriptional regulator